MKIVLINPNVSQAMTDGLLAHARAIGGDTLQFEARTAASGVAVIASRASYAVASRTVLEVWAENPCDCDAILIGCFGDPGVSALRELTDIPVFGLAEEAMRGVQQEYGRFAVVTAGQCWPPMLDELAVIWRIEGYAGTRAADVTGLSAQENPAAFRVLLQSAIDEALALGVQAILLGGAALAGWSSRFVSPVPLLDCVDLALTRIADGHAMPAGLPTPPPIASTGLPSTLVRLLEGRSRHEAL